LWTDEPEKAEAVFVSLQDALKGNLVSGADLPEILNNLGLARARAGKSAEGIAALRRAAELDPDEDDYPVNLGLLYLARRRICKSCGRVSRCHRTRTGDRGRSFTFDLCTGESRGEKRRRLRPKKRTPQMKRSDPAGFQRLKPDGLAKMERIKMELDTSSLQLENLSQQTAASATADASAGSVAGLVRRGRQELSAGRSRSGRSVISRGTCAGLGRRGGASRHGGRCAAAK